MKVTVTKDRCKECQLCIHHCPRKAISKCDVLNANGYYPVQVDDEACIACGMCYITCPDGVFHVSGNIEGEVK